MLEQYQEAIDYSSRVLEGRIDSIDSNDNNRTINKNNHTNNNQNNISNISAIIIIKALLRRGKVYSVIGEYELALLDLSR